MLDQRVALTLGEEASPEQRLITYYQLGEFFELEGDLATAEGFYQRALIIARAIDVPQQEALVTNRLLRLQALME